MAENLDPDRPLEEATQDDLRRRIDWLQDLDVLGPAWEDESLAPPVNEEMLRAYNLHELEKEQVNAVRDLVLRFHSWANAYIRIATEIDRSR